MLIIEIIETMIFSKIIKNDDSFMPSVPIIQSELIAPSLIDNNAIKNCEIIRFNVINFLIIFILPFSEFIFLHCIFFNQGIKLVLLFFNFIF